MYAIFPSNDLYNRNKLLIITETMLVLHYLKTSVNCNHSLHIPRLWSQTFLILSNFRYKPKTPTSSLEQEWNGLGGGGHGNLLCFTITIALWKLLLLTANTWQASFNHVWFINMPLEGCTNTQKYFLCVSDRYRKFCYASRTSFSLQDLLPKIWNATT